MRVFNERIHDADLEGSGNYYTSPEWNDPLGAADKFWIMVVTTQVSGASPTLTVQVETSTNQLDWNNLNSGGAEISRQAISTTGKTILVSPQVNNATGLVRLRMTLDAGGTAHLRVWVTGRAP